MYHIAVVEDDKMYAAQLKEYLKQYEKDKKAFWRKWFGMCG